MLIPNFPPAATHILKKTYAEYMENTDLTLGLSINDYPEEHEFTWKDVIREALDLEVRDLIKVLGGQNLGIRTHITLKLTAYGRRYCEDTLGFQAKTEM